jgi:transcriptional regulator with XRE-family HTH domain
LTPSGAAVIIGAALSFESHTDAETIGQRLRRLRLERQLTQRKLAGPGMTGAYVSRIELGERRPSLRALRELAGTLGVTPAYLETGSEIGGDEERELRLADAELRLRLDGEPSTAVLRSILEEATACADTVSALRARIALGLEAAGRGDHQEAIRQLGRVIESELVTPAARPDVYAVHGESHALVGHPERAAELFASALSELERLSPSDFAGRIRFSTYLSYALTDLGELERASAVIEDALAYVDEQTDPYVRIRVYWSVARIAHEQGKPLLALDHFRHAVALLEATEDTFHLARAYLSCAFAILASDQELDEVAHLIEQAEELLGRNAEPRDLAVVHRLRGMRCLREGDWDGAERHARAARALTGALPNQHALACWLLAEALAGRSDPHAGEAFAHAAALVEQHGTVRERVEVLTAQARYLREIGDEREAVELLERATSLGAHLPAGPRSSLGPARRSDRR